MSVTHDSFELTQRLCSVTHLLTESYHLISVCKVVLVTQEHH